MMRKNLIACAVIAVLMTACVSYPQQRSTQQALVQDLVIQAQLALAEIAERYDQRTDTLDPRPHLSLTKAEVKVSTALQVVQQGKAKLIVGAAGSSDNTAQNYMLLTLFAPARDDKSPPLSPNSEDVMTNDQRDYFLERLEKIENQPKPLRSMDDLVDCESPPEITIGDPNHPTEFWEDLAALTKAAADGYLCAARAADKRPVQLNKLEVNVAFTATGLDEQGFEFKVWKIEVGASQSAKSTTGNSITMFFCSSDCEKPEVPVE